MTPDLKNSATHAALYVSQAVAANANSAVVDLKDYIGNVTVILNAQAATAGTSPTLNIRVMSGSESNGANATNASLNFNEVNSTNSLQTLNIDKRAIGRYMKLVGIIAGTNSPSFPVSATLVGVKQVQ